MSFLKSTEGYNIDYIHLPKIHPDPLRSIELTQKIVSLLENNEASLSESFKSQYISLNKKDKYYFLCYTLEYFSFDYYDTFIQAHITKIENEAIEDSVISYNEETNESISHGKLELNALLRIAELQSQVHIIIDFIRDEFPNSERDAKVEYRDMLVSIGNWFVNESFYSSNEAINPKIYQISLDENVNLFINEIREILKKVPSNQVDSFIYNSFTFNTNSKPLELCNLNFGNSSKTNFLIHSIYKAYIHIIKRKVSRFDFAKVMYLNFQFVRDNWKSYSQNHKNALREDYLKTHVASNIEK